VEGDELQSMTIDFEPRRNVQPGDYVFDVSATSQGRSAGSAPLILQAVLMPLALSGGVSHVSVLGGTHVPWSPSFDYLRDVWLPALERTGITATIELCEWGWFPVGGGRIDCAITGTSRPPASIRLLERGPLLQVSGRAVAGRLPEHIAIRMADGASAILKQEGIESSIEALTVESSGIGAGIFLTARYANLCGGFAELGKRGKPAEAVATEAVEKLLAHRRSGAAVESHLADQLILPLSMADGISELSVEQITTHLDTHAWLVQQFALADVVIEPTDRGTGLVRILPKRS
jgi:RNA 3'-terminal phosphate cyclase (ATP)